MTYAKQHLGKIIREVGDVFTVAAAASCLEEPSDKMAKSLSRWAKQGWLTRIKRGLYAVVPIDASTTERVLEDAWVLIPELYGSCYVGGWSAAEYWDLTEQIFHNICIVAERPPTQKTEEVQGGRFVVTKMKPKLVFATKTIWKQNKKIQISDPHKTIVDMLYNPSLGGGIAHVVDCFKEYKSSEHQNFFTLGNYAGRMENGAVFKRLGFLAERYLGEEHELVALCKDNLSQGNAYLDPSLKRGPLVTRWRLFIPESFKDLA